ncbi:MAG: helix-turn-helix domain-containing protein [Steroidobacteraceae bacterium]
MAVRHGQIPAEPGDARHRLLEAASAEFAERGYAGATVRDIVARAGTNLNAVNYHFGSKQQLYVEVIRHQTALSEAAHPQRPAPGADHRPAGRCAPRCCGW